MSAAVFGENAKIHPVTNMPLESGIGALSHDRQAEAHCGIIEQTHGKKVADATRARLAASKRPPVVVREQPVVEVKPVELVQPVVEVAEPAVEQPAEDI